MESRMIVNESGTQRWLNEHGELHREDGPAIIFPNGAKHWYQNGKRHRTDGPSIVWDKRNIEWWLNNKEFSFTEWANELNLDQKTRLELVLKWNPD